MQRREQEPCLPQGGNQYCSSESVANHKSSISELPGELSLSSALLLHCSAVLPDTATLHQEQNTLHQLKVTGNQANSEKIVGIICFVKKVSLIQVAVSGKLQYFVDAA